MDGLKFEEHCAEVLRKKGYTHVKVTKASGDQGVDVLATRKGQKCAVQCKYYTGAVGNSAVQEVLAGKLYYDCDIAIVMSNSTFTKSARELAAATGVELWENVNAKEKPKRENDTKGHPLYSLVCAAILFVIILMKVDTLFVKWSLCILVIAGLVGYMYYFTRINDDKKSGAPESYPIEEKLETWTDMDDESSEDISFDIKKQ